MNKPPRIAICAQRLSGLTGKNTLVEHYARHLVKHHAWHVDILGQRVDTARFSGTGAVVHHVTTWLPGRNQRRRSFEHHVRNITKQGYDLVCGHGECSGQDILHLHTCDSLALDVIPGLSSVRAARLRAEKSTLLLASDRYHTVIANSQLMRQDLIRRHGIAPDRVRVIYPGYDATRFRYSNDKAPSSLRRRLGIASADLVLGLVTSGNLRKRGADLLIAAVASLPTTTRNRISVIIVGKDRSLRHFRDMAAAVGIGDRLHLLPPKPEVEEYYHAMDIIVHPARLEEFGICVLEAMACGLPVLTSRQVGAVELLPDPEADWIVEQPGIEAIRQRLLLLINNPSARQAATQASLTAAHNRSWDHSAAEAASLYQATIHRKSHDRINVDAEDGLLNQPGMAQLLSRRRTS